VINLCDTGMCKNIICRIVWLICVTQGCFICEFYLCDTGMCKSIIRRIVWLICVTQGCFICEFYLCDTGMCKNIIRRIVWFNAYFTVLNVPNDRMTRPWCNSFTVWHVPGVTVLQPCLYFTLADPAMPISPTYVAAGYPLCKPFSKPLCNNCMTHPWCNRRMAGSAAEIKLKHTVMSFFYERDGRF